MKRIALTLIVASLVLVPQAASADGWTSVVSGGTAFQIEEDERMKDIVVPELIELLIPVTQPLAGAGQEAMIVTRVQNAGGDPRDRGQRAHAGRVKIQYSCWQNNGTVRNLGSSNVKLKKWGVAFAIKLIQNLTGCRFLLIDPAFAGNRVVPAGTDWEIDSDVLLAPEGWGDDCFDKNTLCLNDGRFKAEVTWRDFAGKTGEAIGVNSSDESGILYFFDPDNWEMLVKVLDACDTPGFNNWWVFFASTTDVEYTLTVTDTQTNEARTYHNELGQRAPAITDTSAFATCP